MAAALAALAPSLTLALSVPVTDANLRFSAYNWVVVNGSAAASNPGASLKFGFTNATAVALVLDTSNAAPGPCVSLEFSVDDGPWAFSAPTPGTSNLTISLASGLNLAAAHDVRLYLYASCEQVREEFSGSGAHC